MLRKTHRMPDFRRCVSERRAKGEETGNGCGSFRRVSKQRLCVSIFGGLFPSRFRVCGFRAFGLGDSRETNRVGKQVIARLTAAGDSVSSWAHILTTLCVAGQPNRKPRTFKGIRPIRERAEKARLVVFWCKALRGASVRIRGARRFVEWRRSAVIRGGTINL